MATFAKQLSCFSLIMLSICCHAQARESKFFSKYLHLSTNTYVAIPTTNPKLVPLSSPTPSPSPTTSQISGVPASAPSEPDSASVGTPAPAPTTLGDNYSPAPAPTALGADYNPTPAPTTLGADNSPIPAPPENDIPYYGLYAQDTDNDEEEVSSEINNRKTYTYNKGESNSLSNNNGFWTTNQKSYYNTNNGYNFDGGYKSITEPQGMSDTRSLDNGRYYYDVEKENYNPSGYKNDNEEGYYGNYEPKYEFDSMEEYEKQQGYADVQEEFIP